MQQCEQPDERLMRVTISVGPAAQQPGLVGSGQGAAAEAAGGSVRETGGRVGEADPILVSEAEEVAQRRQPKAAITTGGEERLDVGARAGRPIAHAVVVEVRGELGEDREALLDRVILERVLADPAGTLATRQQPREISLGGGAQRRRAALDPALASAVSEATALVAGEHQTTSDEKRFEQSGCVSRAAP